MTAMLEGRREKQVNDEARDPVINELLSIVQFCAEECQRQQSGYLSVPNMFHAWQAARSFRDNKLKLSSRFIVYLGQLVEPDINKKGFRKYPITVGGNLRDNHYTIDRSIDNLVEAWHDGVGSPQAFYMEYEYIHPFGDGNGRTGKILYNYLNGTLETPKLPDNPFGWKVP